MAGEGGSLSLAASEDLEELDLNASARLCAAYNRNSWRPFLTDHLVFLCWKTFFSNVPPLHILNIMQAVTMAPFRAVLEASSVGSQTGTGKFRHSPKDSVARHWAQGRQCLWTRRWQAQSWEKLTQRTTVSSGVFSSICQNNPHCCIFWKSSMRYDFVRGLESITWKVAI